METILAILFWGVLIGGGTVFIIICFYHANKQKKSNQAASVEQDTPDEPEFTMTDVQATVVDLHCGVRLVGMKTPKSVKEFIVVFRTDRSQLRRFSVPEEMYDGLEIGQTGLLTVVDGQLYGFAPENE